MPQSQDNTNGSSVKPAVTVTNDVMVGISAAIFFFIVVIFFGILYLYVTHVLLPGRARRLRRNRLVFAAYDPVSLPRNGLSSSILEALPITVFKSAIHGNEELECAVCLCELSDDEEVRMLPMCNHGFHLECIDMWFNSHSTCPLCRNPVEICSSAEGIVQSSTNTELSAEVVAVPATSSVSATVKREGMLVIEIPRVATEGFSSKTPTSARRRSLSRLVSRGKRAMGSSAASPGGGGGDDIELGLGGTAGESRRGIAPRIPRNS